LNNNLWNATVIRSSLPNTGDTLNSDLIPTNESEQLKTNPWQWWRDQMPITDRWSYLDHAAVAPLSRGAQLAINRFADEAANLGDTVWPQWAATTDRLRKNVATLLGCESREICLVPNTTTGINLIAEGYPWKPGDNVVIPDGEFPSNLFPWLNQQSRGVEVRVVPRAGGEVRAGDLMSQVDDSTRIIATSWVGYASGYRIDVDDLVQQAHDRGVLVFLDAIQGVGMYPLDLSQTPVDFLASDGHKWLLGPEGAGIAYIRSEHINTLRCGNVGWASVKNAYNYADPSLELRADAARFESGSANMIGDAALNASVELFLQVRQAHGNDAIMKRVVGLADSLVQSLKAIGAKPRQPESPERRSGILTFELPGVEPNEIRSRAVRENVVVSCRDGGVRTSIHAYNNGDDLDRLIDVLQSF
jgi:cysteine desulfurase/selenocysteine lyase